LRQLFYWPTLIIVNQEHPLNSSDVVIVIAQALTGLGHLRISHALYHGLPADAHTLLLSSTDSSINVMHRITSVHPLMYRLMEFTQYGVPQDIFLWLALRYLHSTVTPLEEQLQHIFDQQVIRPNIMLIVATLTSVGHQIAYIKKRFEAKNNVRIVLVSVVTDDSPQHIWAIAGSELIFVPSEYTKRQLEAYHKAKHLEPTEYVVSPYLVSPNLGVDLTPSQFQRRKDALNPQRIAPIHMMIPISGAAVQLSGTQRMIEVLEHLSDRFVFHIVSQQSPHTRGFLSSMIGKPNVSLHVSFSHREVVDLYDKAYGKEVMAIEVTKPSEQSFKALIRPHERGGSILFFSQPVGRQEWDNLKFLVRHGLIPTAHEQKLLWGLAKENKAPEPDMLLRAHAWRGTRLPSQPTLAASYIWWCLEHGICAHMAQFAGHQDTKELSPDGVMRFWKRVSDHLREIDKHVQ
jgi:hypothetical protein